ncbi:PBECR4 domain-containing protein [Mammaliicoccus sciuri]|uniref:PBECR4 domain-containing protein n=1 Tax=Mammaliicoccus sciuri TaxID=1296 RepID=UPI002DBF5E1A|nr:PBECR4 domain-containing protein [Mammaliicoccus sciuri]MEB7394293.1 PBECR4 domain-containing protein [Mammaliicoccus sciuri]
MNNYYIVKNINEINLQMIVNDYIEHFTRKKIIIQTTYKPLEKIEVRFNKNDLHHLLGLHKVQNKKNNATKNLQRILEGTLTIDTIKTHPNYGIIRNRLLNYNFLHKCFIEQSIKLCIIPLENKRNPQKLSVVFIDQLNNVNVLLGLKSDNSNRYYVPATLYVVNDSSIYQRTKRTKIKSMKWEEY